MANEQEIIHELPNLAKDIAAFYNANQIAILKELHMGLEGNVKILLKWGIRLPQDASFQERYEALLEQLVPMMGEYERIYG